MAHYKYRRISRDDAAVLFVDHQCGLTALVQDYTPSEFKNSVLALADIVVDARAGRAYVNAVGSAEPQGMRRSNTVLLVDTRTGSLLRTVELPRLANSSW